MSLPKFEGVIVIDTNKYDRKVEMHCPTCAGTQFLHLEHAQQVTCTRCNRELTRDELIALNQENTSIHLDEIKEDIKKDLEKEMKNMLKKAFGNSKHFKLKV